MDVIQCIQNIPFTSWQWASILSNRLNPTFAFSTFKNTIPTLDCVLYSSGSVGASIYNELDAYGRKQISVYLLRGISNSSYCQSAIQISSNAANVMRMRFLNLISPAYWEQRKSLWHFFVCDRADLKYLKSLKKFQNW